VRSEGRLVCVVGEVDLAGRKAVDSSTRAGESRHCIFGGVVGVGSAGVSGLFLR